MVTLVYRAESVGPVCRRVSQAAPEAIKFVRDNESIPPGLRVRWGSVVPFDGPALNSAESVAVARDKIETRKRLGNLAPPTWFRRQDVPNPARMAVVVRPGKHHAGKRFYVCKTVAALDAAIRRCGRVWYASLLVEKAKEYRIFILQGRVVCVSERFPADVTAIAWNLAMGGRLINVHRKDWPVAVCKATVAAAEKLGLDWCAIDVCVDTGGDCFVFEANTAPGLRNPYTISQIAKALVWADSGGTPKKTEGNTWQSLRHPGLR